MINTFRHVFQADEEERESQKKKNIFNQKILDSIIDDNDEEFSELLSQDANENSNPNQQFVMTTYKLPDILNLCPTYASLCAFFGSEKCFTALSMLCPEGISSENFKETDKIDRSPIHFACAGGCLNIVRELYQAGFDLNCEDNYGQLPSHYSAMFGTTDVMKYLWTKGSDLLKVSRHTLMSPLHLACFHGNLEIVKFLCEKVNFEDPNVNKYINYYYEQKTPLHLACEGGHSNIVEYFISDKIKFVEKVIKQLDFESRTPLVVACQNGSLSCVKLLINVGKTNLNPQHRIHSPLIDAAASGHVDIIDFLLKQKGIDLNAVNSQKLTALEVAILNGHSNVVESLIKKGATKNFTENEIGKLFLMACGTLNDDILVLLDKILKIPYKEMGNTFIKQACKIESENHVSFLIEKNCKLDCINVEDFNFNIKWKPFMTFLKEKGADFSNMKSKNGIPMIVKTIKKGSINSIKEMIDNGVALNKEIITKYNLIDDACYYGNLEFFNFLINYKPEITCGAACLRTLLRKCKYYKNVLHSQRLKDLYQIFEILLKDLKVDPNDDLVINAAVNNGMLNFLELLSKYGANFDKCTIDHHQINENNPIQIMNFLIEQKVDLNSIKTKDGYPLIINPIKSNNIELVEFLISNGVQLNDDIVNKINLFGEIIDNECFDLFKTLMKLKPKIKQPTKCLEKTLGINCKSKILNDSTSLHSRLEVAEILLSEYKANPNKKSIVEFASTNCLTNILELLVKYNANFSECFLDYSRMITSKHLPIFELLENNGCTFQNQKPLKYFENSFERSFIQLNFNEDDKPIQINFKMMGHQNYDINTLLFLVKYASNEDLLSIKTSIEMIRFEASCIYLEKGDKNIIDMLLFYKCFNGILIVFKKLNSVFYPLLKTDEEFKEIIRSCECQELIDFFSSNLHHTKIFNVILN